MMDTIFEGILDPYFTMILEGIFNSCFTIGVVILAFVLTCLLLYRKKSSSKLRVNGKPRLVDATHSSFTISWNRPMFPVPEYYIVYYRRASEPETWRSLRTSGGACTINVTNLSPNTKYRVKVCACLRNKIGTLGEVSDEISTRTFAFKIKQKSTLFQEGTSNVFSKYAVQWTAENDESLKIRKIFIGYTNEELRLKAGKSMLLISTPHSGKTTLIEGIMNHILGVTIDDDFRFCLPLGISDQGYRDWIKVYQFDEYEDGRISFPLTIIDFPRLESPNTESIEMIRELIQSLSDSAWERINCLCLVSKGNDFELPAEQIKYIKSILHFFPDHLMSKFYAFYNVDDEDDTKIEKFFRDHEIAPTSSFFVNWSALFHNHDKNSPFLGRINHNLRLFFDFVTITSPNGIRENVQLPTPAKREELKLDIANTQPEVSDDLVKLEVMKTQVERFTRDRDTIESSGDTSFTIEEIRQIKSNLEPGNHVTNCMQCFFTCHEDCRIPDDDGKIRCSAMSDGYCTVCTGRCIWSVHKNTPYVFKYVSQKVTKSYKEMKANYEQEKGQQLTYDEYLERLNSDIEAFLQRLHGKVQRITECKNELQGISRSPLANSVGDTIDDMIKSETLKREPGYEKRIAMYQELQKYSKMVRVTRN